MHPTTNSRAREGVDAILRNHQQFWLDRSCGLGFSGVPPRLEIDHAVAMTDEIRRARRELYPELAERDADVVAGPELMKLAGLVGYQIGGAA